MPCGYYSCQSCRNTSLGGTKRFYMIRDMVLQDIFREELIQNLLSM